MINNYFQILHRNIIIAKFAIILLKPALSWIILKIYKQLYEKNLQWMDKIIRHAGVHIILSIYRIISPNLISYLPDVAIY